MIICSRCGKENNDQFKYCLGCGLKLQAAVPAPAPAEIPKAASAPEEPAGFGVARNFAPPAPMVTQLAGSPVAASPVSSAGARASVAAPAAAPVVRPMAASGSAPQALRPGAAVAGQRVAPASVAAAGSAASTHAPSAVVPAVVPTQDPSRPRVSTSPQDAVAESRIASAPTAWRPGGGTGSAPNPLLSAPAAASSPSAAAAPVPVRVAPVPSPIAVAPAPSAPGAYGPTAFATGPAAVPAPAPGPVVCPRCGKPVAAGFAFCGACGHRMKAAAAVEDALEMAAPTPEPVKVAVRGQLTLIRPDGTEGGIHPLRQGENLIGRGQGHLFDADPYLSPRHAEFVLTEEGLEVRDLRSLNGVFVKLTQEEQLESGDTFRIGQELLRFDIISPPSPLEDGTEIIGTPNPGFWGRLSVIVGRDVDGPAFPLFDETVVLGRERGDILFPEDGYVSGTHAQIALSQGRVCLTDLGSSNGTFLRVREVRAVPTGSLLLMGQQLFRVAYQ